MSALIRLSVYAVVAIFALVIAAIVMKIVFVLAALALLAFGAVYAYHFMRSLFRRMTTSREPQMLTSGGPTTTTY